MGLTPSNTRAHRSQGLKKTTYSSCGWRASRAGHWGGAARAQVSRSGPEVDSLGGGLPCKKRDSRQSGYGIQMSGTLREGHLREPPHLAIDMAPNSPKWKHSRDNQSFSFAAGEDSSVLVGMTGRRLLSATAWCLSSQQNTSRWHVNVFSFLKDLLCTQCSVCMYT